ncbi:MAG: S53 family peptidase [Chloroflexota bacterium]|nr:S53 family peptidase [Chloroflexota bacterium]
MRRRRIALYSLIITSLVVLIGAGFTTLHFTAQADDSTPVPLSTVTVNPSTQHAKFVQAAVGSQQLRLAVGLQLQNTATLDTLLQDVYNPKSPMYRHYIAPAHFTQLFAPTSDQVDQVTSFLQSNGCIVTHVAANNLLIDVSCSVAQAEQTFGIKINIYKKGNSTFYANSAALKIPKKLKTVITSVSGLDSSEKLHPLYMEKNKHFADTPVGYGPAALSKAYDFASLYNQGILGDNQSVALLELDGFQQSDVNSYYQSYNLNTLSSNVTPTTPTSTPTPTTTPAPTPTAAATPTTAPTPAVTPTDTPAATPTDTPVATPMTAANAGVAGSVATPTDTPVATPATAPTNTPTTPSTPTPAAANAGVPNPTATPATPVAATPTSTATTTTTSTNQSSGTLAVPNITTIKVKNATGIAGQYAVEPTLDLEVLLGLAPHANALVYEGADPSTSSFNDVLSQIVNDNKAQVVSISWEAECESNAALGGEWQTVDAMLKQGAAQGMSFFAASGDAGAYDCKDTNLQVGVPASDPYVTSVGGTTLTVNADNTYQSEVGWSDIYDNLHGEMGTGSGGGISSYWTMPGWQRVPGIINSFSSAKPCNASSGKYCRQIPDVSANADEGDVNSATGDAIYCTVCDSSGWQTVGGTSAAAPVWAAAALLINQYLQSQGAPPMGLANPALYSLFNSQATYAPFHDITTGTTNPLAAFSGFSLLNPTIDKSKLTNYQAGTGYDLVTGMGSPDVYNIALDLSAAPYNLVNIDTFHRSSQRLWGTASSGTTWSGDANTSNAFSITNNIGVVTSSSNNSSYTAELGSSATNVSVLFSGLMSSYSSGNSNMGAVLHWTDNSHWYRAYIDGSNLVIQRAGSSTPLATARFNASSNSGYFIRFSITGTTLTARAWSAGQIEPTNWMVTANDSNYASGYCGVRVQLQNGVTAKYTTFQEITTQ